MVLKESVIHLYLHGLRIPIYIIKMRYISATDELDELVKEYQDCVVIYSASWCNPCRLLKEWINNEFSTLKVVIVDADNPDLESICTNVKALPMVEIFNSGRRSFVTEGFKKEILREKFMKLMTDHDDDNDNVISATECIPVEGGRLMT